MDLLFFLDIDLQQYKIIQFALIQIIQNQTKIQQMQIDEESLSSRIKLFLVKDSNFRNSNFDPAPYLIKVLKEKEVNHDLILKKQSDLIELQNEAQQLMEQISLQRHEDFYKLLEVPTKMGEQLQKLKHNMSNVRKKVKQTKSLLLLTQKDIEQIHLNCMFNKVIFKELKKVELLLNKYEIASLALKNNMYLTCAENLPILQGHSILEAALAARTENLRLRFLSQSLEEIRLFLYFTPKLVLPTSNILIQRTNQDQQSIFNQDNHINFFNRYQLFKKAQWNQYLNQIWNFQDYDRKIGKIGLIHDIVKGIMRIGKVKQITQSIEIDCRKSIVNVFMVISHIFVKQFPLNEKGNKNESGRWFTSPKFEIHLTFLSTILCICGAMLRKILILRRICNEYEIQINLNSKAIFEYLLEELFRIIKLVYFPESIEGSIGLQVVQEDIFSKIKDTSNYIYWPYFRKIAEKAFLLLEKHLNMIEEQYFTKINLNVREMNIFDELNKSFTSQFHRNYMSFMQTFFTSEDRPFAVETFDYIITLRQLQASDIEFCQKFVSEDKKAIKQYIHLISFFASMKRYFIENQFEEIKFKKYISFTFVYMYLKLHCYLTRYLLQNYSQEKVMQVRVKDAKVRTHQKLIENTYYELIEPRADLKNRFLRKSSKVDVESESQYKNVEHLRVLKGQNEMLLGFSRNFFSYLELWKGKAEVIQLQKEIEKHEGVNYEENISSKLLRIWDQLICPAGDSEHQLNCLLAALFRRFVDLHLNISAFIYLESGTY